MKKQILPKGFLAAGIHCGMKKKRKDLALLYSEEECKVAALFTKNIVKAAPLILASKQLKKNKGRIRAVVINSGNANCMTGKQGLKDANETSELTAKALGVAKDSVLVSSTGVIGKLMCMAPLTAGIKKIVLELSKNGLTDAAEGISTTDAFQKVSARSFKIKGRKVTISSIAKGAGMIDPSMATMLCYVMTDANISKAALSKAVNETTEISFNSITVDGDMSTNDTIMLLANGKAGNALIQDKGQDFKIFMENLNAITKDLAQMIVRDGEGSSKIIEVRVKGSAKKTDAKKVAQAIAKSLLVKCAVLGGDPNWGRIASSAGSSGVNFDTDKMEIKLDGVVFFVNGKDVVNSPKRIEKVFKGKEARIEVDLRQGRHEATFYSCDISKKYIMLNARYTT